MFECGHCGECCWHIVYTDSINPPTKIRCLYYDEEAIKHCTIYDSRPHSCRDFPFSCAEGFIPESCSYWKVSTSNVVKNQKEVIEK